MTTLTTLANRIRYEAGLLPANTPAAREQKKRLLEIAKLVQAESERFNAVLDAVIARFAECRNITNRASLCLACTNERICDALDAYDRGKNNDEA